MTSNPTFAEAESAADSLTRCSLRSRELERIAPPSVDAFEREYVSRRRPVVLRGIARDWPAVQHWTLDSLRQNFGSTPVTTIRANAGRVVMDADGGSIEESLPLGVCIEALQAGALDRYITSRTAALPASLQNDIRLLPYCADAAWRNSNIWMGGAGTIARMHRDLADNLHIQVFGRKRFTLVAPAQSSMVYPNTLFDKFPNGCRSDIEQPDFDRFPKMRGVEPWIAELEPGDAIYIPRRWWHHVRTLAISMAVNYWWASGRHRFVVLAADYAKRIRGISR